MKGKKRLFIGVVGLVLVAFFCGVAMAAEKMTITGTINDDGALVADDGKTYEITESEKGAELSGMTGKKVSVTGEVEESEGEMEIDVEDFKAIE